MVVMKSFIAYLHKMQKWFFYFTATIFIVNCLAFESSNPDDKIDVKLWDYYHNNNLIDEKIPVYVIMAEQYNTKELYYSVKDLPKSQRREKTVNTLKEFSHRNQKKVKAVIEELQQEALIEGVRYFWLANMISMNAEFSVIEGFAEREDVAIIIHDPVRDMLPSLDNGNNRNADFRRQSHKHRHIADNVVHINAPMVWDKGYRGEGALIAVIDTGVNYNHQDISSRMWIHPDYPYHGYNTANNNYDIMDSHGHGTHCAGTVAGDGTSGIITGIAPEATIMGIKVLNGNNHTNSVFAGIQFAVEKGADILSISLGWSSMDETRNITRQVMDNVLTAGVISSVAAGNEARRGITAPGSSPPPWLHPDQTTIGGLGSVFTVGAINLANEIAPFSSIGPVEWSLDPYSDYILYPGVGLIKPDICAVGVDVLSLSHSNINGYTTMSGTSMATPAVAGVMALMLSKNPYLKPEDMAKYIEETATPLSERKSNTFGSGLVDANRAVENSRFIDIKRVYYNGKDSPDYNETVNVGLALFNRKYTEIESLSGTISTNDNNYVTILNGNYEFSHIPKDSVVTFFNAFSIRTEDNVPHNHLVEFSLNLEVNNQYNWDIPFTVNVNSPKFAVAAPMIIDSEPYANNNGVIDPGEIITLYLPTHNTGGAMSPPVEIVINSRTNKANVLSNSYVGMAVPAGEIIYPDYLIEISEGAQYGEVLSFSYTIDYGSYSQQGFFNCIVGGSSTIIIGDGDSLTGINEPSPINTGFKSLRSQTLYTAQEINEQGVDAFLMITGIGYYVETDADYSLPDFVIRMKHSTADDLLEHDEGPFMTVYYNESYAPVASGWDMLALDTPFLWNGVDNILIDTAFSPVTSFRTNGQVRINRTEDSFRYINGDMDCSELTTKDLSDSKPHISITFGQEADELLQKPFNLSAALDNDDIYLTWSYYNISETDSSVNSRKISYRSNLSTRQPEGYNIYRNGLLINELPVTDTYYFDSSYNIGSRHYYYVTALYEDDESPPSNVTTFTVEKVSNIEMFPTAGVYYESFNVSMVADTDGSDIHYTLDGTEPTCESILYEGPFEINYQTLIRSRAYKSGMITSDENSAEYHILYAPNNLTGYASVNAVEFDWDKPWSPYNDNRKIVNVKNRATTPSSTKFHQYDNLAYNLYKAFGENDYFRLNAEPIINIYYIDKRFDGSSSQYYVTAVYPQGESKPSNILLINPTLVENENTYGIKTGLLNAYPNPFNPETTIVFTLKDSDSVKIDIYNILGQKVNTIVNNYLTAGRHSYLWSGDDSEGRHLGSGIYFYKMTTFDYQVVKKMMLIR